MAIGTAAQSGVDPVLVDRAAAVLGTGTVAVLTGAGISTDSGIPDYRGEGAPRRTPMSFQQFRASERHRKRYWAGSHLGWRRFHEAAPNLGHIALARLEEAEIVNGVITQNVDGLHSQAGNRRVVELHGSVDRVVCMDCGQYFARHAIEQRLLALNPDIDNGQFVRLAPDGDAEVTDVDSFIVPECSVCGGTLKPDVVFFGEFVPVERFVEASAMVSAADSLLVLGSSLAVNTGIRLLEIARRRRLPIVIVNRGGTKGDSRATVRIEGGTSQFLTELAARIAG